MTHQLSSSNAIGKLLLKVKREFNPKILDWNQAMEEGRMPYGRIIRPDSRRIYLNGFVNKIQEYLLPDYSNLYEATTKAIEGHRPEQYSSKKHCLEASISLAKFLIYKGVINE